MKKMKFLTAKARAKMTARLQGTFRKGNKFLIVYLLEVYPGSRVNWNSRHFC